MQNIITPGGQPIRPQKSGLIVIKTPEGIIINPKIAATLGSQTQCNVISLPMDSSLMMGKVAMTELLSSHMGIHAILDLPTEDTFSKDELATIQASLKYLIKHTHPNPDSFECRLEAKVTKLLK